VMQVSLLVMVGEEGGWLKSYKQNKTREEIFILIYNSDLIILGFLSTSFIIILDIIIFYTEFYIYRDVFMCSQVSQIHSNGIKHYYFSDFQIGRIIHLKKNSMLGKLFLSFDLYQSTLLSYKKCSIVLPWYIQRRV